MLSTITYKQAFLSEVRAFMAETGMSQSALGARALNDSRFVARLEGSGDPRLSTVDRVRDFMAADRARRAAAANDPQPIALAAGAAGE